MSKIYKILIYISVILIIVAGIFFFSDQTGTQSHGLSGYLSALIARDWLNFFDIHGSTYDKNLSMLTYFLEGPIRKLAHLFIYNVLGFFSYYILYRINNRKNRFRYILFSLLLVLAVATLDEINQYYSGGRGASIKDVVIDCFGGLLGIYMVFILRDFYHHLLNGFNNVFSNKA